MKRYRLRTSISVRFVLLVLALIALISIISGVLISRQFEHYVIEQQRSKADEIAAAVASHYDGDGDAQNRDTQNGNTQNKNTENGWNIDYIHGMGMYALNDGFILKLYDKEQNVLWDAENHDMTYCHDVMSQITERMKEKRPDLQGNFVTHRYDLENSGAAVGYLDINYYSPYYMNENEFQFLSAFNRILFVIGGVSLIGAAILGIIMADRLTRPMAKMVEIIQKISRGNYEVRLGENTREKEMYELTQAVNQMAESLSRQENLRRQLTQDVTHELRTPVANISSYMEMMIEEVMDPTPERLKICYDELNRLSGLISDLECLRDAEACNLVLEKTEVELFELAEVVLRQFETQMEEKELESQVTGDQSVISADRDRICQVLTNLISNAVKYSQNGGRICVDIEDRADRSILTVTDEGIGIPEEDLERIFERFYRTDKSRDRKTGGAGIGLAIVNTIVQAHGGSISAKRQDGKGSRFVVVLPKYNL